jgi:hypothetical protein
LVSIARLKTKLGNVGKNAKNFSFNNQHIRIDKAEAIAEL